MIQYDRNFKDINLLNFERTIINAVGDKNFNEVGITTSDSSFFLYQRSTGSLTGPIPLPGYPTALRVFEPLPEKFFVCFVT